MQIQAESFRPKWLLRLHSFVFSLQVIMAKKQDNDTGTNWCIWQWQSKHLWAFSHCLSWTEVFIQCIQLDELSIVWIDRATQRHKIGHWWKSNLLSHFCCVIYDIICAWPIENIRFPKRRANHEWSMESGIDNFCHKNCLEASIRKLVARLGVYHAVI